MTTQLQVREGRPDIDKPLNQGLALPGDLERLQAVQASSKFVLPVGTHWVENDVLSISNEITARWPNLRVASCPCNRCLIEGHYPHVILEHCKDGITRPVFGFSRFSRDVVDRLKAIHASENPQAKHRELNARKQAEVKQQAEDAQRERLEVVEAALKSRKRDWRGPNGLRTDPHAKGPWS